MLLKGVNFEGFDGEGAGNTPSPKQKLFGQKRRREEEIGGKEEEEEKEEEDEKIENDKKKIRRGGGRWNRGGRHVENVSVTTNMQFGMYTSFYNHF